MNKLLPIFSMLILSLIGMHSAIAQVDCAGLWQRLEIPFGSPGQPSQAEAMQITQELATYCQGAQAAPLPDYTPPVPSIEENLPQVPLNNPIADAWASLASKLRGAPAALDNGQLSQQENAALQDMLKSSPAPPGYAAPWESQANSQENAALQNMQKSLPQPPPTGYVAPGNGVDVNPFTGQPIAAQQLQPPPPAAPLPSGQLPPPGKLDPDNSNGCSVNLVTSTFVCGSTFQSQ